MKENKAFKNWISPRMVQTLAKEISDVYPKFDQKRFLLLVHKLDSLELKARVLLITAELKTLLPESYPRSLKILLKVLRKKKLKGFELWPFSEFIGQFGLDHFEDSLKAMHLLTQQFTSEFAIRSFFLKDSAHVLEAFNHWVNDENVHVRRWISEGSRPLLPWGARLPSFVADPTPTIKLLEQLKYDDELYVRKSVANHLNDISKNHPKLLTKLLNDWEKNCPALHRDKIQWIKRHALRTLIKKGDASALKLIGVTGEAKISLSSIKLNKKKFQLNDLLQFKFKITSTMTNTQKLVIDYAIDFVKANGKKSSKVYKLKNIEIGANEVVLIKKSHNLKPITTMTYYPGKHHLMIQINGKVLKKIDWDFQA